MRGAVWDGVDLVVTDELSVRDPVDDEVLVDVVASGICHSDLNTIDGISPRPLPVVLGHEAAGRVAKLGPRAKGLSVGDAVCVGSITPCYACRACSDERFTDCRSAFSRGDTSLAWREKPVHSYANISSFAGCINVKSSQLVRIGTLPFEQAALIGCAVITGFGVVRNVARVREGDTVVIFGIGGIGVNAVQTSRLRGAERVIAVDANPARASTAETFGATQFVTVERSMSAIELADAVRGAVGGPADKVIECTGSLAAIEAGSELLGAGGTLALVGIPSAGARASFDVNSMLRGKRIVGSLAGAMHPTRDISTIVRYANDGYLNLADQVTRVWPIGDIGSAIAAVRRGEVVRAVVLHEDR